MQLNYFLLKKSSSIHAVEENVLVTARCIFSVIWMISKKYGLDTLTSGRCFMHLDDLQILELQILKIGGEQGPFQQ